MTSRHSRRTTTHRADGTSEKKCPNGITSTIVGLYKYWKETLNPNERGSMSVKDFLKDGAFAKTYQDVVDTYRGIGQRGKSPNLTRLLYSVAAGQQELEFYRLRAFAQFVGLPTGIFLVFTQCVSDEVRCKENGGDSDAREAQLLALIHGVRRVMDLAEKEVREAKSHAGIFVRTYDQEADSERRSQAGVNLKYVADVKQLKSWVDAFNPQ